jgi:hypothetical protein
MSATDTTPMVSSSKWTASHDSSSPRVLAATTSRAFSMSIDRFSASSSAAASTAASASGLASAFAAATSSSNWRRSASVSGGQAALVSISSPSCAIGARSASSWASGGTTSGGPSKTSRSGLPTVMSTIDRIRSAPRPATMIQPNPASHARA